MASPLLLRDWNEAFNLSTPVRPSTRRTPSKTNWKLGTAQVSHWLADDSLQQICHMTIQHLTGHIATLHDTL